MAKFCTNCGAPLADDAHSCGSCGQLVAPTNEISKEDTVPADSHFEKSKERSYFDGGLLQLIGWYILGSLVTTLTLGICYPWSFCMIYNWETKHTVINGHRLRFTGTALQLFGNWIKWFLLTVITFGIYGFWLDIKLKKWKVKHTEFVD